jgi:5-enolpyruvylshikimate-3-phosphate synthase
MASKTGRGKGYLGENIFYEDNEANTQRKQGYKGTCLPNKDFPDGCPLLYFVWKKSTIQNARIKETKRLKKCIIKE